MVSLLSASVLERCPLTAKIQIPYRPIMIVVNTAGRRPARRAQVYLLCKRYPDRDFLRILPDVFQNNIFHIQLCDIILRRQSIPLQVVDCCIFILPVRACFVFSFLAAPQLLL